jgi:hypothetical protein
MPRGSSVYPSRPQPHVGLGRAYQIIKASIWPVPAAPAVRHHPRPVSLRRTRVYLRPEETWPPDDDDPYDTGGTLDRSHLGAKPQELRLVRISHCACWVQTSSRLLLSASLSEAHTPLDRPFVLFRLAHAVMRMLRAACNACMLIQLKCEV